MSDAPTPKDQTGDDPSPEDRRPNADHERRDGGSPANLFTHGRTGEDLHDVPDAPSEAEDAGDGENAPSTVGRTSGDGPADEQGASGSVAR